MVVVKHDHLGRLVSEQLGNLIDVKVAHSERMSGPGVSVGIRSDFRPNQFVSPADRKSLEHRFCGPGRSF